MVRVLFVCLGNICRSPIAEGVFRRLVVSQGLLELIEIDSAGTQVYYLGSSPDARAQAAAVRCGVDLSKLRARQAVIDDLRRFDLVLAMDRGNRERLQAMCPRGLEHKIRLLMEFAPGRPQREIPDPYLGRDSGFDLVVDMIEEAAAGLLEHIRRHHLPRR